MNVIIFLSLVVFFAFLFFFKSLLCFSLKPPVGGGIPHGVLPEMGPGGNAGPLTEHRPRWTGAHETVQSPPDTMRKHNKAQADTEAGGQGAAAASSALAPPRPGECKREGGKRGSVSWAPDPAKDLVSESASDSACDSLTDAAASARLGPVTAGGPVTSAAGCGPGARKLSVDASADREAAGPRRGSTGEPRVTDSFMFTWQTGKG